MSVKRSKIVRNHDKLSGKKAQMSVKPDKKPDKSAMALALIDRCAQRLDVALNILSGDGTRKRAKPNRASKGSINS